MYERTVNRQPRTNNNAEAGHRRFQVEITVFHPTKCRFIDVLRKSQKTQDNKYDQLESRFSPKQEKAEVHATGGQATENSYGLQ